MNTPVHFMNITADDIAAESDRYGVRQLAQDLLKFWCTDTRFAHLLPKHNGDYTT